MKKEDMNGVAMSMDQVIEDARTMMAKDTRSLSLRIVRGIIVFWAAVIVTMAIFFIVMVTYRITADKPIGTLSDGVMVTRSAKMSYKGYLWHTYDGWTTVGIDGRGGLEKWNFTVEDNNEEVVKCIMDGDKVRLHYHDYIWMPFKKGYSYQVYSCEQIGAGYEHE